MSVKCEHRKPGNVDIEIQYGIELYLVGSALMPNGLGRLSRLSREISGLTQLYPEPLSAFRGSGHTHQKTKIIQLWEYALECRVWRAFQIGYQCNLLKERKKERRGGGKERGQGRKTSRSAGGNVTPLLGLISDGSGWPDPTGSTRPARPDPRVNLTWLDPTRGLFNGSQGQFEFCSN